MQPFTSHQKFIDDLIQGLQDGSITPQKINVHMDMNGLTYYDVEFVDKTASMRPTGGGGGGALTHHVQAMPGAKVYAGGGKQGIRIASGTEPITGFRDFEIQDTLHGLLLRSRNGAFWPPRERFRALCQKGVFADHDVPSLDCECGVYAYDNADHSSLRSTSKFLWGEIAMWGDVLICETGYRAEFAYPTALFIRTQTPNTKPSRTMGLIRDELSETYGVPVFLVEKRTGQTSSSMIQEALNSILSPPILSPPPEDE